eukprot:2621458-Amphidinium_carterae.1
MDSRVRKAKKKCQKDRKSKAKAKDIKANNIRSKNGDRITESQSGFISAKTQLKTNASKEKESQVHNTKANEKANEQIFTALVVNQATFQMNAGGQDLCIS